MSALGLCGLPIMWCNCLSVSSLPVPSLTSSLEKWGSRQDLLVALSLGSCWTHQQRFMSRRRSTVAQSSSHGTTEEHHLGQPGRITGLVSSNQPGKMVLGFFTRSWPSSPSHSLVSSAVVSPCTVLCICSQQTLERGAAQGSSRATSDPSKALAPSTSASFSFSHFPFSSALIHIYTSLTVSALIQLG